jgi:sec-independent protein translocase protein TatB
MFPEDRFLEILIIGALALIVIGPKDLPILMRRLGQFIGKMRGMAAEFRASFDELARQSELDELRREVEALRHTHAATPPSSSEPGDVPAPPPAEEAAPAFQLTPPMSHQIPAPTALAPEEPTAEPAPKPKAPRKPRVKAAKPAGETS